MFEMHLKLIDAFLHSIVKMQETLSSSLTVCVCSRVLYTYTLSQKFNSIRISLLRDITEIKKNQPYR